MKRSPSRYYRPAVFLCDEYQAFASVGEDDPSGDEKSFALTRQCRCIPIVATQSISSLRSVLGSSEAWRALLQTLRTRIFLSLSDDASARIASDLCGQVAKIKPSYTINETSRQAEVSLLSARRPAAGAPVSGPANRSRNSGRPSFTRATRLALELPGHLPALRRRSVAGTLSGLSKASLSAPEAVLLVFAGGGRSLLSARRAVSLEHLQPVLPGTRFEIPKCSPERSIRRGTMRDEPWPYVFSPN